MSAACSVVAGLERLPFFSSLNRASIERVAAALKAETFRPGDTLCVEGSPGDRMFIIETGLVSVLKRVQAGMEMEVAELGPGEIAGEMSIFSEMTRSATLRAKNETKAWSLSHSVFQDMLRSDNELAMAVLGNVTRRLRRETSVAAQLMGRDVDRRFRVAFFDAKPYMERAFNDHNPHRYAYRYHESRLGPDTVALAAGANAVCVFVNDDVNADVVDELHAMGVDMIALRCAGFNNVDIEACRRLGVSVTRVPAYSPHAVAEHAVALMMALNRKIHRAHNRVREANFALNGLVGFDMHGKTVGFIGVGRIGQCALRIMRGFGCRLLAHARRPIPDIETEFGAAQVPLEQLLRESDIISLHAPLSEETHHMINAEAIAAMKPGVMLINTGRGGLIDTHALLDGLRSGKIGYAGLDVYEEESAYFFEDVSDDIIADDVLARLLTFNNVIVTSHQAFLTKEALAGIAETTVASLREYETGRRGTTLTYCVATA